MTVTGARDLSSAFGAAAVSSVRGRDGGARRSARRRAAEPAPVIEQQEILEDDVQDSNRRVTAAPKTAPHPDRAARRRLRVAPVRDRRQIDVLLLAVAGNSPASGREFIALVREHSDGVFLLTERAVYHELHRLTNNRLLRVTWKNGSRKYLLTALGERVLTTRRREWNAFSYGFDRVLDAAEGD